MQSNPQAPTIDCKDIVFLGRLNTYEIIIAKILSKAHGLNFKQPFEIFLRKNHKALVEQIKQEALYWKIQRENLATYRYEQSSEEKVVQYQSSKIPLKKLQHN